MEYHQFCSEEWCGFKAWETENKPLYEYKRETKKDFKGKEIKWKGGLFAKLKIEHPQAYNGLKEVFVKLGSIGLMERCSQRLSQNVNESIHARLWKLCLKIKMHGIDRYNFCAKYVILVQNFGYYAVSLHHVLGSMTKALQNSLKKQDVESLRSARRKYVLKEGGKNTHRVKQTATSYDAGMEPF